MHKIQVQNLRGNHFEVDVDRFPDECPICQMKVFGTRLLARFAGELDSEQIQLIYQCTNYDCEKIFVSNYERNVHIKQASGRYIYNYTSSYPSIPPTQTFSEEINNLSNNFVDIYNQSLIAENYSLTQLNGVGLRKSLEFLVKDFAIYKNDEVKDKILQTNLGQCINQFIEDVNVKECAKRAAWLGNDETHYLRRWEDKDIEDLKLLIKLTVNWIENVLLTEKYINDMSENKNV